MAIFQFKEFSIHQVHSAMKVGTDAMILGALIHSSDKKQALDIGSGTGVLSLMVAQRNKQIFIDAIEIDTPSCNECRLNFQTSLWKNRLSVIHSDFLENKFTKKYDLIFTNPPFYVDGLKNLSVRKARAKHADFLPAGMLFEKVSQLLTPDGECWIIIPVSFTNAIKSIAYENQLYPFKEVSILGKPSSLIRQVLAFSFEDRVVQKSSLLIRDESGNFSEEYIGLTKDFHSSILKSGS